MDCDGCQTAIDPQSIGTAHENQRGTAVILLCGTCNTTGTPQYGMSAWGAE